MTTSRRIQHGSRPNLQAAGLLNSGLQQLKNVEDLLVRARVDLAELKRTGAREGLPELLADMTELKSELEQLKASSKS
jgi:hypothetical protein